MHINQAVNLVIVASGSASRLKDIHQDLYPKLLVNIGQEVFIKKLIDSYASKLTLSSITIIVNSELAKKQITEAYCNLIDDSYAKLIEIIIFDKPIGTAKTLLHAITFNTSMPSKNVLIAWSDIYPEDIDIDNLNNAHAGIIFVDKTLHHRIAFDGKTIITSNDKKGNIPGIFYIKNLHALYFKTNSELINCKNEVDFTEILQDALLNGETFDKRELSIVDIGDMSKYEHFIKDVNLFARFFNNLEFHQEHVNKMPAHQNGIDILANEIEYYRQLYAITKDQTKTNFAKVIKTSTNFLSLERIHGLTVHDVLCKIENTENHRQQMYSMFTQSIHSLHAYKAPISESLRHQLIVDEYFTLVNTRLLKMSSLIPEILSLNGHYIHQTSMLNHLTFVVKFLSKTSKEFTIIHGDPNSSNVMIDNDRMIFIDPRGKFGHASGVWGDPRYDFAKFLYGLTGYDTFNLTKDLRFTYDDGKITSEFTADEIIQQLDELTDDIELKLIVSIIWLKLPFYTINNINKSILSYAIGLQLLEHYSLQIPIT